MNEPDRCGRGRSTQADRSAYTRGALLESAPLAPRAFPFGRRPRPGDRVPDLECLRPDGAPNRLHAELGGRWALLAADGSTDACVAAAGKRPGDYVVVLAPVQGGSGEVLRGRPGSV